MKNGVVRILVWLIMFALTLLLLWIVPEKKTDSVLTILVFDCVTYISQLVLWLCTAKKGSGSEAVFRYAPIYIVSAILLGTESAISIMVAFLSEFITPKFILISNVILISITWLVIVVLLGTKEHTHRVASRQKDHHVEL